MRAVLIGMGVVAALGLGGWLMNVRVDGYGPKTPPTTISCDYDINPQASPQDQAVADQALALCLQMNQMIVTGTPVPKP